MDNKQMSKVQTVSKNEIYRNKQTKEEVVVFFVNMGREVRFSPVGRGVEDRLPVDQFLDQYERVEQEEIQQEAQKADEAAQIPSEAELIARREAAAK